MEKYILRPGKDHLVLLSVVQDDGAGFLDSFLLKSVTFGGIDSASDYAGWDGGCCIVYLWIYDSYNDIPQAQMLEWDRWKWDGWL
jgi:hypothetical protein